ncbi:MAG: hypothetical protein AAFW65_01970 [Pseudomonadota bacterium]
MSTERRITSALIVAVVLETAGALLWAGGAAQRLTMLEDRAEIARPISERLARVETTLTLMQGQLRRIEEQVQDDGSDE